MGVPAPDDPDEREWIREHWEEIYGRERGLFTDTDRRFLAGLKEYGDTNQRSNRRRDIRTRVENAILDAEYLAMLPEGQRRKIAESLGENWLVRDVHLAQLIGFLYQLIGRETPQFETLIESAVMEAEEIDPLQQGMEDWWNYEVGEVEVDIDIDHTVPVDRLDELLREGRASALSAQQIGLLVRAGKIDADDLAELDLSGEGGQPGGQG